MNKNLIAFAITSMVAIVLIGSVLMPILDDASTTPVMMTNSTTSHDFGTMDSVRDPAQYDVVITVDRTDDTLSIGAREIDLTTTYFALVTDSGAIRINQNAGYLNYAGSTSQVTVSDGFTITVVDGVYTLVTDAAEPSTYTWTSTEWAFITNLAGNGAYRLFSGSSTYYVNDVNQIWFAHCISTNSLGFVSAHGAKALAVSQSNAELTMGLTATEVSGYTDLLTFTSPSAYAVADGDYAGASSGYIVLPITVTAHAESVAWQSMLFVIPVILIMSLIIGAAVLVRTRY